MVNRWKQVQQLFDDASRLQPEQRQAFLERECGPDAALLTEVDQLLHMDQISELGQGFQWSDLAEMGSTSSSHWEPKQIGPFRLLRKLGGGSMGVVYLAEAMGETSGNDAATPHFAVKILRPWLKDTEGIRRFEREQQALATLQHPHIVRLVETGFCEDGSPFLAMEYVNGHRLDDRLRNSEGQIQVSTVPLTQRLDWMENVLEAIAFAHEHLLLHRDLKPGNILIGPENQAIVTDFGLVRPLSEAESVTRSGQWMGTLPYMAPEQLQSKRGVGLTTDVYGLGAVLYFLLTGHPPFDEDPFVDRCQAICHQVPVRPSAMDPSIPRDLETICLKCLRKDPTGRYPTVDALLNDMRRFRSDQPIAARTVSSWERLRFWGRRNPSLAVTSTLLVMLMLVSAFSVIVLWRQAESHSQLATANLNRRNELTVHLLGAITSFSKSLKIAEQGRETLPLQYALLSSIVEAYSGLEEEISVQDDVYYDLAVAHYKLGQVQHQLGMWSERQRSLQMAELMFRRLMDAFPEQVTYRFDLFHSLNSQARYVEALEVMHNVYLADGGENPDYVDAYGHALLQYARVLVGQQKLEEADKEWQAAMDLFEANLKAYPDNGMFHKKIGEAHAVRFQMKCLKQQPDEAQNHLRLASLSFRAALERNPGDQGILFQTVQLHLADFGWNMIQENPDQAKLCLDRVRKTAHQFATERPSANDTFRVAAYHAQSRFQWACRFGSRDEMINAGRGWIKTARVWADGFESNFQAQSDYHSSVLTLNAIAPEVVTLAEREEAYAYAESLISNFHEHHQHLPTMLWLANLIQDPRGRQLAEWYVQQAEESAIPTMPPWVLRQLGQSPTWEDPHDPSQSWFRLGCTYSHQSTFLRELDQMLTVGSR